MKIACFIVRCSLALAAAVFTANAATITFNAILTPGQEVPASVGSRASGLGSVVLDDVADTITVNESWTNLAAPATLSHIHGPAAPGSNAPVLFPFSGVPNVVSGSIPQQVFSITAAQIAELEAGLFYMNVHDSVFPAGEIRGQLAPIPEPESVALLGLGAVLIAWRFRSGLSRRMAGSLKEPQQT
jgi:CHRD domain/PEP-CTERM motif